MTKKEIIFIIIWILILFLVWLISYKWTPNNSDKTIKAIHMNVAERNILQIQNNELLKINNELTWKLVDLVENGLNVTVNCED